MVLAVSATTFSTFACRGARAVSRGGAGSSAQQHRSRRRAVRRCVLRGAILWAREGASLPETGMRRARERGEDSRRHDPRLAVRMNRGAPNLKRRRAWRRSALCNLPLVLAHGACGLVRQNRGAAPRARGGRRGARARRLRGRRLRRMLAWVTRTRAIADAGPRADQDMPEAADLMCRRASPARPSSTTASRGVLSQFEAKGARRFYFELSALRRGAPARQAWRARCAAR